MARMSIWANAVLLVSMGLAIVDATGPAIHNGVVRLPTHKVPLSQVDIKNVKARSKGHRNDRHQVWDEPTPVPVDHKMPYGYLDVVTVSIGTPPQDVELMIDSGSSELWVDPSCDDPTVPWPDVCNSTGSYSVNKSTTSKILTHDFESIYGGRFVEGWYVQDDVAIGDYTVRALQFGYSLLTLGGVLSGVFGIAPGYKEKNLDHPNFIDRLNDSRDVSVYLGPATSNKSGSLLFGGIDAAKFAGLLQEVDVEPQVVGAVYSYFLEVTRFGFTHPGSCRSYDLTYEGFSVGAVTDTGTSALILPPDVFQELVAQFDNAEMDEDMGLYSISCGEQDLPGGLDIVFAGGAQAQVPLSELLVRFSPTTSPFYPNDTNVTSNCYLAALPGQFPVILGQPFMRTQTFLFREDQHKVYFAPAADCGESIISLDYVSPENIYGECSLPAGPCGDEPVPEPIPAEPTSAAESSYSSFYTIQSESTTFDWWSSTTANPWDTSVTDWQEPTNTPLGGACSDLFGKCPESSGSDSDLPSPTDAGEISSAFSSAGSALTAGETSSPFVPTQHVKQPSSTLKNRASPSVQAIRKREMREMKVPRSPPRMARDGLGF